MLPRNIILACVSTHGVGVDKQVDIAAVWYRKAAEQGNVNAQFALGMYYSEQTHLPEHYQAAAFWFEKAAAQGDADAQFH